MRDSHFGVTDVTATCFALAGLLYVIRFDRSHSTRDLVVAAIWSGLAMSTKYGAAMVAVPALAIALWPASSSEPAWPDRLKKGGAVSCCDGDRLCGHVSLLPDRL